MSSPKSKKKDTNPGLLASAFDLYKVYECRMAINLLEPWEKCLANSLVLTIVAILLYCGLWVFSLLARSLFMD